MEKDDRRCLRCSVSLAVALCSAVAAADGFVKNVRLAGMAGEKTVFSLSLDRLVSARGEQERYAPCDPGAEGVEFRSSCSRRPGVDAWDARTSVSNASSGARFLRLVFRAKIPFAKYAFWNGYINQKNMENNRASVEENAVNSYVFPAFAAMGKTSSLVMGFDPGLLASRVDTMRVKGEDGDSLEMAFPVYLPPGDFFDARVTLACAPSRYRWHDVVERWYELYPAAFAPLPDVHPGLSSAEAGYIFWNPKHGGLQSITDQSNALRRHFGDRPCWEWCYRPFARAGDWAMTDRWSVGWKGYTAASLESRRQLMRARLAPAKYMKVAPMWYLNVTWTERDMALKEFPGIALSEKPHIGKCWDQPVARPIYSAGGTAYEKLFRDSLERIPRDFPDVKGIGWDSCFARSHIPENHIGFAGTPRKSFYRGVPFAHEAVGISGLLDHNHRQFSAPHRMANAVNYKLTAPWMIAARTDSALYEGTPMTNPKLLWRLEAHRARLGGRKIMTWHSGCRKSMLGWANLDKMSPEDADDAHRQILDDNLLLSYYWGVIPAAHIVSENRERFTSAIKDILGLAVTGWHASPACDAPKGVLVARYGEGDGTRLAVINPGYGPRTAELFLPGEYWPAYPGGKRLSVCLPARQVMIVDPATGKSRLSAALPPSPVKKPLKRKLLEWMAQSSLL